MRSILVIDDDQNLRDTVCLMLERAGFRALQAGDGQTGYEQALLHKPDLILIDLMLPGIGGAEVCKQLRMSHIKTPIIVLSAIRDEVDKVVLLELGADDYVVKPFGTRELLARIHALLRRCSQEIRQQISFSGTDVDLEKRSVTRAGQELKLTPSEYNLLTYLVTNSGKTLTREIILNAVWGYDYRSNTRTLDTHIVKLRQKIEEDPSHPRHVMTVHGVGYRFVV